jgi:CRISPR/Cas system-associated exonuclease Cas4 (RecB family)
VAIKRPKPYIWATWITKLLAGENQCAWAAWFRAHYRYDKLPRDVDLAAWTVDHGEMVRECCRRLTADGYEVLREEQNSFKLVGQSGAVLSGKPDIVAMREQEVRVIDCKTGTPRNSDQHQVMLYLYALPLADSSYRGKAIQGEVVYRADAATVPASAVDETFKQQLARTLQLITTDEPPDRVPSYGECRFCDISRKDCPDRVDTPPREALVDFF